MKNAQFPIPLHTWGLAAPGQGSGCPPVPIPSPPGVSQPPCTPRGAQGDILGCIHAPERGGNCAGRSHVGGCGGRERWQEFNLYLRLLPGADLALKEEKVREQMHECYFIWGVNTAIAALSLLGQYRARHDEAGHGWAGRRAAPICINAFVWAFFSAVWGLAVTAVGLEAQRGGDTGESLDQHPHSSTPQPPGWR